MSQVIAHKCPNCDGPLLYDPDQKNFNCEYCLSIFDEKSLDDDQQKKNADQLKQTQSEVFDQYACSTCGAEIVTTDTTAATFCYYCHNPIVLKDRISGTFLPNQIIPFQISEDSAKQQFLDWTQKKRFIPHDFFDTKQIEAMTGVYFPYWNTEATLNGSVKAKATKVTIWRVGEIEYTRTRKYRLVREGTVSFKNFLNTALQENQKNIMVESIQPFPEHEVKPFHSQYLSGFQAEKRDLEFSDIKSMVQSDLSNYTASILENQMNGYTHVTVTSKDIHLNSTSNTYCLLPIWLVTYHSKNNDLYYYALNGATGKVSGKLPIDKPKLITYSALVGIFTMILFLIGGYWLF